jgi:predicted nucleic acid-binding protein
MVVVDTSVWIDYLVGTINPHTLWLDDRLAWNRSRSWTLSIARFCRGGRHYVQLPRVRQYLDPLTLFNTGGKRFALAAADNYRLLRRRGVTVRTRVDCLIASFCLAEGHFFTATAISTPSSRI